MKWQTLAPELIYEILGLCCADSMTLSATKLCFLPWYLGHISRAWREVFVSSPQFWKTLSIHLDFSLIGLTKGKRLLEHVLEVARISMVRSRDCPISFRLSVTAYSQAKPAATTIYRQMIEILVANSARWLDAYLYIPANEMATIYAAKGRMRLLRSINLQLRAPVVDDSDTNTTVRSRDAAKLYSDFLVGATQLTRISFNCDSRFWKINWSLITVVDFCTTPPLSQLLAYLSQMSCLMELFFRDDFKKDIAANDETVPITLPRLKSLYSPTIRLLPIVETPALQELHIHNGISIMENKSALKAIISRYFQPIRHLSKLEINTLADDGEAAALIIEHTPRVDHLIVALYSSDLLQILNDCPQMDTLKTMTFMLDIDNKATEVLLETITSWKREAGENKGIGPFHNLTEMSFKLLSGSCRRWEQRRFMDRLKLHLEEQGMYHSITVDPWAFLPPEFDVL